MLKKFTSLTNTIRRAKGRKESNGNHRFSFFQKNGRQVAGILFCFLASLSTLTNLPTAEAGKTPPTRKPTAKRSTKSVAKVHPAKRAKSRGSLPSRSLLSARKRWDTHLHATPPAGRYDTLVTVRATAYMPIDSGIEGGRWTATERDGRSAHGIAVDPRLIPLGSHVWIPGYGHAIADDTGGAIRGHRVDVRMQTRHQMNQWGVRKIRVYVLRRGR